MITPLGLKKPRKSTRVPQQEDIVMSDLYEDDDLSTAYTTLCERVIRGDITDDEYNAALDYAVRLAAQDQRINLSDALRAVRNNRITS